jgi:hypothetical protein
MNAAKVHRDAGIEALILALKSKTDGRRAELLAVAFDELAAHALEVLRNERELEKGAPKV